MEEAELAAAAAAAALLAVAALWPPLLPGPPPPARLDPDGPALPVTVLALFADPVPLRPLALLAVSASSLRLLLVDIIDELRVVEVIMRVVYTVLKV